MSIIWGIILIVFTLILCWLMQVINAISPALAAKLGVAEAEDEIDRTFFLDGRGKAIWDALILWTLPVAGILLLLDDPSWAYFGLVGGGMYLYFAGRGLMVRRVLGQHDIAIGEAGTRKLYNGVLFLWGLIAVVTIFMAVDALPLA
ncbi:MAG TPA: hypothetical protein VFI27_02535 [candidate division Zixibacteria bacterium]|nr:hypothetical protein [candidate division Zixibacteria bacterium]